MFEQYTKLLDLPKVSEVTIFKELIYPALKHLATNDVVDYHRKSVRHAYGNLGPRMWDEYFVCTVKKAEANRTVQCKLKNTFEETIDLLSKKYGQHGVPKDDRFPSYAYTTRLLLKEGGVNVMLDRIAALEKQVKPTPQQVALKVIAPKEFSGWMNISVPKPVKVERRTPTYGYDLPSLMRKLNK